MTGGKTNGKEKEFRGRKDVAVAIEVGRATPTVLERSRWCGLAD